MSLTKVFVLNCWSAINKVKYAKGVLYIRSSFMIPELIKSCFFVYETLFETPPKTFNISELRNVQSKILIWKTHNLKYNLFQK